MAMWRRTNPNYPNPDDVRMTLGEHLEELRSRLIRAIIALVVGAVVCFIYRNHVIGFLCAPIFAVLKEQGYPQELAFFGPAEGFMINLKVAIIVGFILTAPFSISQIWGFIAAGLYPQERKWVRRFAPASIILFFLGAAFLLLVVSPLAYKFLLTFQTNVSDSTWLLPKGLFSSSPRLLPATAVFEEWPTGSSEPQPATSTSPATQPISSVFSAIPAFDKDPKDPPEGYLWTNRTERQIRIQFGGEIYTVGRLLPSGEGPRIRPDIRISENIVFVLQLSAAFGIAFQIPVVVAFLAAVGIAPVAQMARLRRYVWFGMSIASAIITPTTDVVSMLFLLLPMVLLYEVGLWIGRIIEKGRPAAASE